MSAPARLTRKQVRIENEFHAVFQTEFCGGRRKKVNRLTASYIVLTTASFRLLFAKWKENKVSWIDTISKTLMMGSDQLWWENRKCFFNTGKMCSIGVTLKLCGVLKLGDWTLCQYVCTWGSHRATRKNPFSFLHVGLRNWFTFLGLSHWYFYLLGKLPDPKIHLFFFLTEGWGLSQNLTL